MNGEGFLKNMKKKILIADDYALMRTTVRDFLSSQGDFEIIGEAENGQDAVMKTEILNPDIIIMDIGMPVMNGIEATKIIHEKFPGIFIVALTMYQDRQYLDSIMECGAYCVIKKDAMFEMLQKELIEIGRIA